MLREGLKATRPRCGPTESDLGDFQTLCDHYGADRLPAALMPVAVYLAPLVDAGPKACMIGRRLSAIAQPTASPPTRASPWGATMAGIRHHHGLRFALRVVTSLAAARPRRYNLLCLDAEGLLES